MSTWVAETTNGYCSTRHRHINDDMVRAGPPPSIDMMRQNDCLLGVSVGFLLPLSVGRCAPTVQFRLWAATLSSSGSFVTFVVTLLKVGRCFILIGCTFVCVAFFVFRHHVEVRLLRHHVAVFCWC